MPIADGRDPVSRPTTKVADCERVLAAAKRHKQHGPAEVEICGRCINRGSLGRDCLPTDGRGSSPGFANDALDQPRRSGYR